jgi:AAA15 family ATPase/GTPase
MFSKSQIAENTQLGKDIVEIIRRFDTGIDEIKVEKINPNNLPEDLSPEILKELKKVLTKEKDATIIETEILHKTYDDDYNPVGYQSFDFSDDESAGTQKLFSIIGPILDTLQNGYILVIDELDSRLHPSIVNHIINLFNSNITNPKNAQFIFNTHNTNLLNEDIFRRDQIWFVEKNRYNESKVYSLADIKVRKEENFEQKYLNGRYGGVPFIENIADVLKHFSND